MARRLALRGGLESEYGITSKIGISLGAIYSQQGGKYHTDVENSITTIIGTYKISEELTRSKVTVDNINVPLLANFYVWRRLALKAGIQLGILVNDKMTYRYDLVPSYEMNDPYYIPGQDRGTHIRSKLTGFGKSIDFGIPIGLSYDFHNLTLDARYYFGLTKIDSPNFGKNRCLYINLGYRIPL